MVAGHDRHLGKVPAGALGVPGLPGAPGRLIPDEDQEKYIAQILADNSGGCLIGSEMGSGKTLIAVEYVIRSGANRILVACPLGTRIGWERTFRGQGFNHPVYRIDNTKNGKIAQEHFESKDPGVYLIGHAMFRIKRDLWPKNRCDVVVYDEVQDACNRKSQGFGVLKTVKAGYKIAMSATWFGNKFENAWAPNRWLWWDFVGEGSDYTGNRHVDTAFSRWRLEWCSLDYDPYTYDNQKVVGEKAPGKWANYLPLYIRAEAKLDISAPREEDIYVDLTRTQRKAYDDLERDALTWLEDNPLVAELPIVVRTRLRQVALGELAFTENGEVGFNPDCKSPKVDALKEFLANHPDEPVLIYVDSKRFAKVVAHRLPGAMLWDGDTPQQVREGMLARFGTPGNQYLIATIAAMGAGVDGLQTRCNTVVWLSQTENNNLNVQALGRLHRRGQDRDVLSVYIKAVDTLDEGIYGRMLSQELNNRASMSRIEKEDQHEGG